MWSSHLEKNYTFLILTHLWDIFVSGIFGGTIGLATFLLGSHHSVYFDQGLVLDAKTPVVVLVGWAALRRYGRPRKLIGSQD